MRSSLTVAVALLAASCAHPGPGASPSLAGAFGNVRFDSSSVTGPSISMSRGEDGNWRGVWPCSPAGGLCPGEVIVRDEELQIPGRRFGLTVTGASAAVHEAYLDVLVRRPDGGPVPRELIVPIWLAYELAPSNRQTPYTKTAPAVPASPSGRCVRVDGLGTVEVIVLPRRGAEVSYDVEVQPPCDFRFSERVAQAR